MFFGNLPQELLIHLLHYLPLYKMIDVRTWSRELLKASVYYRTNEQCTVHHISSWKISFPYLTNIRLRSDAVITDTDFKELSSVSKLDIAYCRNLNIVDTTFAPFRLKKLYLRGIYSFTDELCSYITEVEEFTIEYSKYITNKGIQQLTKLKYLDIDGSDQITMEGFVNCSKLIHLRLCHMELPDDIFKYMPKLEIVYVNFGIFTANGILSLKNLRDVGFCSMNIDCTWFDQLVHLKKASFSHNLSICDDQFIYLKNLKELLLYHCPHVHGKHVHYLTNINNLYIYETPLETRYMCQLLRLTKATDILISRCKLLTASYMKRLEVEVPVLRYLP